MTFARDNVLASSPADDADNEYLALYRSHLRNLAELTRPAFRSSSNIDPDNSLLQQYRKNRSSRVGTELQLTSLSVLFVQTMVAPVRRLYAWGVPTSEALDCIEEAVKGYNRKAREGVVEIGAGTGYWASLLRRRGVPVSAYDLHPCHSTEPNGYHKLLDEVNSPSFAKVTEGSAESAGHPLHAAQVLLLCWPPQEDRENGLRSDISSMASTALRAYQGSTLVYVGEVFERKTNGSRRLNNITFAPHEFNDDGATGGPSFHRILRRDWILEREVMLPRWPGASDSLTIWSRKRKSVDDLSRMEANETTSCTTVAFQRSNHSNICRNEDDVSATLAAKSRKELMRHMREAWEETVVAHIVNRVSKGGARPRQGIEQSALDAIRRRSGMLRKLFLMML